MAEQIPVDINKSDDNCAALSIKQQEAVNQILLGKNDKEVAAAVGVKRGSIWRWRQEPQFQAALAKGQQQTELYRTRFEGLISQSLDLIEQALNNSDVDVALAVVLVSDVVSRSERKIQETQSKLILLNTQRTDLNSGLLRTVQGALTQMPQLEDENRMTTPAS